MRGPYAMHTGACRVNTVTDRRAPPCYDFSHFLWRRSALHNSYMPMLHIFSDASVIAEYVSNTLTERIKSKPQIVLGLATGGTMEPIYAKFVQQIRDECVDVSQLTSFNLDEYVGLPPHHPKSYASYMEQHLFQHLDFDRAQLHLPNGLAQDLDSHCQEYSSR